MAAASYLDYDAAAHTYRLPEEHAYLLASEDTDHFMGGLYLLCPNFAQRRAESCRCVSHRRRGAVRGLWVSHAAALDMINGGQYEQRLGNYWLTKLPDVIQRLENGGRVLDVGCGVGLLALRSRRRSLNAKSLGSILIRGVY